MRDVVESHSRTDSSSRLDLKTQIFEKKLIKDETKIITTIGNYSFIEFEFTTILIVVYLWILEGEK
jgi:hypothetical protein